MTLKLKLLNMASAALMVGSILVTPAFAASDDDSVELTSPIIGAVVGGGGTATILLRMSRTKNKKIEADDNIDTTNSTITRSSTDYVNTVCTHRGKN